jgi:hypothetical protein
VIDFKSNIFKKIRVAMALGMYWGSVHCVRLRLRPSSPSSSSLYSITIKLLNFLISYSGGLLQLLLCCFFVWLKGGLTSVGAAALAPQSTELQLLLHHDHIIFTCFSLSGWSMFFLWA